MLTVIVSIITLIHSDNYLEKIATKITLADIAREARVGVATVDRVLNKRAAVKESTARRVLETARRLGFTLEQPTIARLPAKRRSRSEWALSCCRRATPSTCRWPGR